MRPAKIVLLAGSGLAGALLLIVAALLLWLNSEEPKARLEKTAGDALEMEVRLEGRLGIGFFPSLLVTLNDLHLRNRDTDLLRAEKIEIGIKIAPLLRKEFQIKHVSLKKSRINIERDQDGRFNFQKLQPSARRPPLSELPPIFMVDATVRYADRESGLEFTAEDCSFTLTGESGVFEVDPLTMRLFGGRGTGKIRADFTGAAPRYSVHYSLSRFRIEDFLRTRSPEKIAAGEMDFSADLKLQGDTAAAIRRTAAGNMALRGEELTFFGGDLDLVISRIDSAQTFNLVDAGAFLLAGPIGLAATRGAQFANLMRGTGASSQIRLLVSEWRLESGLARAEDVAMTTGNNRLALTGTLDLVNERFSNVVIALLDDQGCAKIKQQIDGPFQKPVIEQPSVIRTLAEPLLRLFQMGTGKCEMFYSGSVPHSL